MLVTNIIPMGKRERTKAQLQTVAVRLFRLHGYEATTVEQIAAEAGVSAMTFFRHFPSKSSVLFDDPYDPLIGATVAQQPAALPALERARRGLLQAWAELPEPDRDDTWERVRIVDAHPSLRARMWENNQLTHQVIVAALRSTGTPPLEAEVAAGACLGAITAALFEWARTDSGGLGVRIETALGQLALAGQHSEAPK
ncbi:TetR/AcrR family transcriptional regulator [Arthrobacter sp. ERGS1:01]|uniref:TetR/AcrR family transcriptional regulator n=1 Tax=Arthrobacter sp. ERGS1:01 TaxID=1704044 RepID=UPI000AEFD21F|nr:TetR/AcrR family transcriptional regulator [Arthrobacter sp. ERGS1:01]